MNIVNTSSPHFGSTLTNVSTINALNVEAPILQPPPIATPDIDTSHTFSPSGHTESNVIRPVDRLSEPATSITSVSASDAGGSYASTLPDVFDFDVDWDGLQMAAAVPWVAVDHLTGEIIVGDDSTLAVPASGQTPTEVGLLPRLVTHTLNETEPPALLSEDEDVRPDWLLSAVKGFLRYTPYYGGLGRVVDQFLLQEARLGYPNIVCASISLRDTPTLTTPSPCV